MKKLFTYYNFILVSVMVILGFLNAQNYSQLIGASLFFPLTIYFTVLILPKRNKSISLPEKLPEPIEEGTEIIEEFKTSENKFDFDRRTFLKFIGSAGLSVFIFALFTKKAEAAFFGSVPGPGTVAIKDTLGTKIDPAEKHPTDGYNISELDDSTPAYYGFTNKVGNWFVMKEDAAGSFRYCKGDTSFSTNWTNRASLTYGYFDSVF